MSSGPFLFAPGRPVRARKEPTMPKQNLRSQGCEDLSPTFKNQSQQILEVLLSAEGAEIPLTQIMGFAAAYTRCIHGLRRRGYKIINRVEVRNGVKYSWYRLDSSPAETSGPEPAGKKSSRAEPRIQPPPPANKPEPLSLFPDMPAVFVERATWLDPELDGVKKGSVKNG